MKLNKACFLIDLHKFKGKECHACLQRNNKIGQSRNEESSMTDMSHMSTTGLILSNVKPVDLLLIAKKNKTTSTQTPNLDTSSRYLVM